MNNDSPIGRVVTIEEAETFFLRVMEAEKLMGPITFDERLAILKTIGTEITAEELAIMLQGKRVLILKDRTGESNAQL